MKKIIIIIIAVVLVAAGVTSYFLFFNDKEAPVIRAFYVPGDFFVTNIKDSKYLLKSTIVIELNQEGMDEYLSEYNHVIRDIIVFTLRDKTEDELRSTGVQDELRAEIVARIKSEMEIDYIVDIYFNDYVIQ